MTTYHTIHGLTPGQIRLAWVETQLADSSTETLPVTILILDVRPHGDQDPATGVSPSHVRVLWEVMSPHSGLPGGTPRWSTVEWTRDAADDGPVRLWLRTAAIDGPDTLVGTYQPLDPDANSLEILRDQAIAQVEMSRRHADKTRPADVGTAAAAKRAADDAARSAQEHLYATIRDAISRGVSVIDLATQTGLSRDRIYQIRDGRR